MPVWYIKGMINGPKLTPNQWKLLSSAFSNMSQAILLFLLAAFFVPEVVGLKTNFSKGLSILILIGGLSLLGLSVIIVKKGK